MRYILGAVLGTISGLILSGLFVGLVMLIA